MNPEKPQRGNLIFPLLESWYKYLAGERVTAGPGLEMKQTGAGKVVYFNLRGDAVLYKGLFYREYDEDGVLISVGSETGTTPDDIDTGHKLILTRDWTRIHE